jgi:hypothetical protein
MLRSFWKKKRKLTINVLEEEEEEEEEEKLNIGRKISTHQTVIL